MRSQKCACGWCVLTVISGSLEVVLWRPLQTQGENQKSTNWCQSLVSSYWLWTPVARPSSSHKHITVVFYNRSTTTPISAERRLTTNSPQPSVSSHQQPASNQQSAAASQRKGQGISNQQSVVGGQLPNARSHNSNRHLYTVQSRYTCVRMCCWL